MRYDIWKFTLLLLAAAILGYSLGFLFPILFLTSLAIIVWQIYRLNVLYKWVSDPRKNPMPEVSGQLYLMYRSLNRKKNKSAKRKRQLTSLFSQFREAVGALPDAIVLIDQHEKIEWSNKNAEKVLGIRWPEDSGVPFSDLIRQPEVHVHLKSVAKSSTAMTQGILVSSPHDNEQTISINCVSYSKKLRMVVARDVSRLVTVNKMQRDFVANVSHELKTPLTVLKGYIEILQNLDNLPEELNNPLEQMAVQGERMHLIVSDLLYLAKLEDEATVKISEAVNVSNLITSVVEVLQPLITRKGHKLELDIESNLLITGVTAELHSVFSNLITNAINYTPDNGRIHVHWHTSEKADYAVFSVKDNGPGVAAEHIARLTQRFYRIDTDRSRDGGGTGLGLAIVKHILQRHDATLDITSKVGKGSEFKCYFRNEASQLNRALNAEKIESLET